MRRGPIAIAALVLIAMVATVASQEPGADSPLPVSANQGPRGTAVLATWLREAGVDVRLHDAPLTELPADVKVLVLVAPSAAEVRTDEAAALERFVREGGTLVYLMPRSQPQPVLNEWLQVSAGPIAPLVTEAGLEDVGGTTVKVTLPAGALAGATKLRLSANAMVKMAHPDAVPVVEAEALWWWKLGRGEVWVGAGPDLAENSRLELADNARFWAQLATRGPVLFDEFHHHAPATALPVNLVVSGLQLGFLALLLLWARGPRLGKPRDPPLAPARSAREYVSAMATLTQNAKVEGELVVAIREQFRRTIQEAHGIPASWSWEEIDAEFARRGGEAGAVLGAVNGRSLLEVAKGLAEVEARFGM